MKLSKQIIGLPLYSLAEGKAIGTIKGLVCNPAEGAVNALLLDGEAYYLEMRGVPLNSVIGIGDFAATVMDTSAVMQVTSQPSILSLLEANVKVLGSSVLTKMGEIIGTVTELAIDEKTGAIAGCELAPLNSKTTRGFIARSDIITFGQQYLVVDDQCIDRLVETPDELDYTVQSATPGNGQAGNTAIEVPDNHSSENGTHDLSSLFHERQRQFLLGRKVDKRLVAASGEIIAEPGEEITEELIEKAIAMDKYLELTMNTYN